MTTEAKTIPTVSVTYARTGSSTKANAFGMRPMQERVYEKRGEQYLILKSPPASGKSRALCLLRSTSLSIRASSKPSSWCRNAPSVPASTMSRFRKFGFWADWHVEPKWNLCNAPGWRERRQGQGRGQVP